MRRFCFTCEEDAAGERVDRLLPSLLEGVSRSYLQRVIKEGGLVVNGKQAKGSLNVKEGDALELELPDAQSPDIPAEDIPLDILYEDSDVIVVNKPKGMVVHPAAGHYTGTLVNALMYHCGDSLSGINGVMRPGIVHRIDKDTTGSVIACKNDAAHMKLSEQFKAHSINRVYKAICLGVIPEDERVIDAPIGRLSSDRKKMGIVPGGKRAVTHVKVLERFADYTFIECRLETGRTHQIRVHLSSIGHPILGDEIYGKAASPLNKRFNLEGQTLHAQVLGFEHPSTGDYVETVAPLPQYFEHLLNVMK
ncbi:MAG: RluA family pseudouridine synthase [Lachnospiraceae bacterium]|nr:RluA family pseudouridine synthase [Lachnospiraceae bacterium]